MAVVRRNLSDLPTDALIPLTAPFILDDAAAAAARAPLREALKICLTRGEALLLAGAVLLFAYLARKKEPT